MCSNVNTLWSIVTLYVNYDQREDGGKKRNEFDLLRRSKRDNLREKNVKFRSFCYHF